MIMRGKEAGSLRELIENLSLDDLINAYYSGELDFFLRKCGEDIKTQTELHSTGHDYQLVG